jgi:RNA polymerase sigma factor (sigma-70 family)
MADVGNNDAQLVKRSLTGDREAFRQIVERYQSLVCSITYGATGSLPLSEDIAQETFVAAWKQLAELREPLKLRAWLCGIARFLVGKELRVQSHELLSRAEPLDDAVEPASSEPTPAARAISDEEAAILWRALERIPETYRDPLILFYREQESVERVAEDLELSVDAVKQRLSRGRKLLAEEVVSFVEGTLKRTAPNEAFTQGVLAALPIMAGSTKAAVVGAAAAKGSALAHGAAAVGIFGAIFGPIIGLLSAWVGVKASIENTQSPRERQFMVKMAKASLVVGGLFCAALIGGICLAASLWSAHPALMIVGLVGLVLGYTVLIIVLAFVTNRIQRRIRQEEAAKRPLGAAVPAKAIVFEPYEYRSRWTWLGLPLIHVCMESKQDGKTRPAKGWIAIGNIAYGLLFACGGVAVAPVSLGGGAAGLLTIGGMGVGLVSFAGVAMGVWVAGGMALGRLAFAGCAVASLAAKGGTAVAHSFAVGGAALAEHANDAAAQQFMQSSQFMIWAEWFGSHALWLVWLPCGLLLFQFSRARGIRRQR